MMSAQQRGLARGCKTVRYQVAQLMFTIVSLAGMSRQDVVNAIRIRYVWSS